jgi:predicted metal-dependent HD superfamily phosphohydrolase
MLTDTFLQLVNKYSSDNELATNLWLEIFTKYSEPKRHYHTIGHLEAMIANLNEVKANITDWDTTLFAVFYHDIIYKASSSTNEGDSAKLAMKKLSEIGYPAEKVAKCANMIMATKQHELSEDNDTNYLTDADLAILGSTQYDYQKYTEQIREEYSIFPDFMFNNGRKKALQHFLQLDVIYKTDHFFKKYEKEARTNIKSELTAFSSLAYRNLFN